MIAEHTFDSFFFGLGFQTLLLGILKNNFVSFAMKFSGMSPPMEFLLIPQHLQPFGWARLSIFFYFNFHPPPHSPLQTALSLLTQRLASSGQTAASGNPALFPKKL